MVWMRELGIYVSNESVEVELAQRDMYELLGEPVQHRLLDADVQEKLLSSRAEQQATADKESHTPRAVLLRLIAAPPGGQEGPSELKMRELRNRDSELEALRRLGCFVPRSLSANEATRAVMEAWVGVGNATEAGGYEQKQVEHRDKPVHSRFLSDLLARERATTTIEPAEVNLGGGFDLQSVSGHELGGGGEVAVRGILGHEAEMNGLQLVLCECCSRMHIYREPGGQQLAGERFSRWSTEEVAEKCFFCRQDPTRYLPDEFNFPGIPPVAALSRGGRYEPHWVAATALFGTALPGVVSALSQRGTDLFAQRGLLGVYEHAQVHAKPAPPHTCVLPVYIPPH